MTLTYSNSKINLLTRKKDGTVLSAQADLKDGIVENSVIKNEAEFAKILKITILNKLSNNPQIIIHAAIPEEKSYIQILEIPPVPFDKVNQVIRWQSKSLLTFDIENVYIDTQIIESSNKLKILVTASPKILIESLVSAVKKTGFKLNLIDTRSGALARRLAGKPHQLIAIAEIQDKNATIILAKNGIARFSTNIELTKEDRPFVGKLNELIEFYTSRKETSKKVEKLLLIGDAPTSEIKSWEKSLNLKIEKVRFDQSANVANLGMLETQKQGVNLLPKDESKKNEEANITSLLKHSQEFLIGVFLIFSLINLIIYYNESAKLITIKTSQTSTKSIFTKTEIDELIQTTSQISEIPEILPKSLYLKKIFDLQTEGISISEIIIEKNEGTIKGSASLRSALINFSNALKADKSFSNVIIPLSNFENKENIPIEIKFTL